MEVKIDRFSDHLRSRLLSDNYGNWSSLDSDLLEDICDRMGEEVKLYFNGNSSMQEPEPSESKSSDSFNKIRPLI